MYTKILVPLDGSELAEAVLPYASAIAQCTGAELVLLRVTTEPVYEYRLTDVAHDITLHGALETRASDYLEQIAARLRGAGLKVSTHVETGEDRDSYTILEFAEELQPDLIAMSTHGRTGLGRAAFGSVAENVLRGTRVPLLLICPH